MESLRQKPSYSLGYCRMVSKYRRRERGSRRKSIEVTTLTCGKLSTIYSTNGEAKFTYRKHKYKKSQKLKFCVTNNINSNRKNTSRRFRGYVATADTPPAAATMSV